MNGHFEHNHAQVAEMNRLLAQSNYCDLFLQTDVSLCKACRGKGVVDKIDAYSFTITGARSCDSCNGIGRYLLSEVFISVPDGDKILVAAETTSFNDISEIVDRVGRVDMSVKLQARIGDPYFEANEAYNEAYVEYTEACEKLERIVEQQNMLDRLSI